MEEKLKPCPFCSEIPEDNFVCKGRLRVQCNNPNCPIYGMQMDYTDWNRRAK